MTGLVVVVLLVEAVGITIVTFMMEGERYLARAMDLSFTIRNVLVILVDNKRNQ
ncbi:MAG: hypothetical protein WAL28_08435 [Nitrososphaeraceae archaeon]|jgi:hypothetical protein